MARTEPENIYDFVPREVVESIRKSNPNLNILAFITHK